MKQCGSIRTLQVWILCVAVFCQVVQGADEPLRKGKTLPELQAIGLDNQPISFRPPAGQYLLIAFWNMSEPGRNSLAEEMLLTYKRFQEKGLGFISVYIGSKSSIASFTSKWKLPWPQIANTNEGTSISSIFGVPKTPFSFLVNSEGTIAEVEPGGNMSHELIAKAMGLDLKELPLPELPTPTPRPTTPPSETQLLSFYPGMPNSGWFFGSRLERQRVEPCKANLRAIGIALTAYQQDHNDELPEWLSDLYPKYIQDTQVFLCPLNKGALTGTNPDPKMETGYTYEFAPTSAASGGGPANLSFHEWKESQLDLFGDKVPMVRCLHHARTLNLTYGGEICFYEGVWENEAPRGISLSDFECRARKNLRLLALASDRCLKERGEFLGAINSLTSFLKDDVIDPTLMDAFSYPYDLSQQGLLMQHRQTYGDYVPIVRVRTADDQYQNLSYHGEIWISGKKWEEDVSR